MATASPADARIFSLDAIRGVAVMGIFSVNVVAFAMIDAAYFNPRAYGGSEGVDLLAWATNMVIIDGKMRSLFSMLFGASMLLVIDRAEASGDDGATVHFRRMVVLLLLGFLHYLFIWWGDILVAYALAGMVAYFARHSSVTKLIALAATLICGQVALFGLIIGGQHVAWQAIVAGTADQQAIDTWAGGFATFLPDAQAIAADKALHLGTYAGTIADKLDEVGITLFKSVLTLPETLGLMLLGMAGYRSGFLTGDWSAQRYRTIVAITLIIGFAGGVFIVSTDVASDWNIIVMLSMYLIFLAPIAVLQAAGYAALIIILAEERGRLAKRIAAAGRCAFSNYIGTSLVATFVFYGWGLGHYGSVSRAEAWLLVPMVWALMLLWSKPWLDRYRYGPLEWVWRSLSRGSLQPMRKAMVA